MEYQALSTELLEKLKVALPNNHIAVIQAYATKPDFGDIDIVVENTKTKETLHPILFSELGFNELVTNGNT